MIISMFYTN